MRYWILTDTHFNHKRMIDWGRPKDFEKQLLDNLSATLKTGDILIHLGDVSLGNDARCHKRLTSIQPQVTKILVRGNHDEKSDDWYYKHGWDFVCDSYTLRYKGTQIQFSHMPVRKNDDFWAPHHPIDINIHGHFHGNNHRNGECYKVYDYDFHYDCAPDTNGYSPLLLDDIIAKQRNRPSRKKIVLAGNVQQFEEWLVHIKDSSRKRYVYAADATRIMGMLADEVVVIGTAWERPDYYELLNLAKSRIR